jgi:hypothetical protein
MTHERSRRARRRTSSRSACAPNEARGVAPSSNQIGCDERLGGTSRGPASLHAGSCVHRTRGSQDPNQTRAMMRHSRRSRASARAAELLLWSSRRIARCRPHDESYAVNLTTNRTVDLATNRNAMRRKVMSIHPPTGSQTSTNGSTRELLQRGLSFDVQERLETLERLVAEPFDPTKIGRALESAVLFAPRHDPLGLCRSDGR